MKGFGRGRRTKGTEEGTRGRQAMRQLGGFWISACFVDGATIVRKRRDGSG